MIQNFNFLFQYLEKEEITIDKKEFEFQYNPIQTILLYYLLLDTLSFFNIDNGSMRLASSEIELLPNVL